MSRDKLIGIGVVVLGILGGLVYMQAKEDEKKGAPLASAKDFPTISAPDDVDKISITNGDKGEVVLEKVPDPQGTPVDGGLPTRWSVAKPVKADANQQAVKDLVANLKDLKVDSRVNLVLDDGIRKDKQLDAAHGVHVVAWKGADKKVDELFGKSGPAGQLVVMPDKPDTVYAAKGYSSYLYTKEAKEFRDKELFKFDDANASRVTITNTHGTFSFTKGDKWAGTHDKKPIPRFRSAPVDRAEGRRGPLPAPRRQGVFRHESVGEAPRKRDDRTDHELRVRLRRRGREQVPVDRGRRRRARRQEVARRPGAFGQRDAPSSRATMSSGASPSARHAWSRSSLLPAP
jgi:hypothetical protein